jgi:hypothetical protein
MYNFHWPRLYTLDAVTGDGSTLTLQFQKETQISRVELEYQLSPRPPQRSAGAGE